MSDPSTPSTPSTPSNGGDGNGRRASAPRVAAAAAVALLGPVALAILIPAARDHLPDPLPTHWGTDGVNGYTSRGAYGAILLGIAIAGAVAAIVFALVPRLSGVVRRAWLTVASVVAWGAVGCWAVSAGAAWNAPDASKVALNGWVIVLFVLAIIGGALSHLAFGPAATPPLPALKDADVPVAQLAPGERVAWSRRLGEPMFLALGVTLLGLAVLVVLITGSWGVGIPLVLAAVVSAAFASVRLSVDRRGLTLSVGGIRGLGKHIHVDDIDHASAIAIEPLQWGGWGYRVGPGRSAFVLRRGPGLVVDLTDGRRFAVTVDDPATPAALLNALRASARS